MQSAAARAIGDDAWSWRPSRAGWLSRLRDALARWAPAASADGSESAAAIRAAIATDSSWLVHPALGAVTDSEAGDEAQRTRTVIAYIRAHGAAGEALRRDISVDPEARASGIVEPESWAADCRLTEYAEKWRAEQLTVAQALASLREALPAVYDWVADVVPIVTPLFNTDPARYRSWSWASIPGTVFIDTHAGQYAFLESLVHESAHRYFLLAEANAPLAAATNADFPSPLRPEPRPLRAILFAYHALAYMSAFQAAYGGEADAIPAHVPARLAAETRDARDVLRAQSYRLTTAGREFLAHTDEVAFARVD